MGVIYKTTLDDDLNAIGIINKANDKLEQNQNNESTLTICANWLNICLRIKKSSDNWIKRVVWHFAS